MKHKSNIFLTALLILSIFSGFFACGRQENQETSEKKDENETVCFVYPSEFGDWLTLEQKIEQCRIPEDVLNKMTVEELVWAVIDFPFLVNAALTDWPQGLDVLAEESDAFARLAGCEKPEEEIISALQDAEETESGEKLVWVSFAKDVFYHGQEKYFDFSEEQLGYLSGGTKEETGVEG